MVDLTEREDRAAQQGTTFGLLSALYNKVPNRLSTLDALEKSLNTNAAVQSAVGTEEDSNVVSIFKAPTPRPAPRNTVLLKIDWKMEDDFSPEGTFSLGPNATLKLQGNHAVVEFKNAEALSAMDKQRAVETALDKLSHMQVKTINPGQDPLALQAVDSYNQSHTRPLPTPQPGSVSRAKDDEFVTYSQQPEQQSTFFSRPGNR